MDNNWRWVFCAFVCVCVCACIYVCVLYEYAVAVREYFANCLDPGVGRVKYDVDGEKLSARVDKC